MYRHILLPTDGSEASARAERMAAKLARTCNARITAVHVIEPPARQEPAQLEAARRSGLARLRRTGARLRRARVDFDSDLVHADFPAEAIVDAARERSCDLIVMATSARVGLERLVLGSVATDVLMRSKTPVLVCR